MKTTLLTCLLAISLSGISTYSHAQGFLDKVGKTLDKVDRNANQADEAGKKVGKIGSMFGIGKGKKQEQQVKIFIENGNLAAVKKINSVVQKINGVSESEMQFDAEESVIIATYNGSAEDLLSKIQAEPTSAIKDEDVTGLGNGKINIRLK